jgi:hypothetical protein
MQEIRAFTAGHLDTHQHATVRGTVVAVMKQADIPTPAQAG